MEFCQHRRFFVLRIKRFFKHSAGDCIQDEVLKDLFKFESLAGRSHLLQDRAKHHYFFRHHTSQVSLI
jgi:hypothetical protein